MTKSKFYQKWHIKPRVFVMLLLLLLVVFSSIFIAFNLFINGYIQRNVESQLTELVDNFGKIMERPPVSSTDNFPVPDLSTQPRNKIGAWGEVILLDSDYVVRGTNPLNSSTSSDEATQIAAYLREQEISLTAIRNMKVVTSEGKYFISSIEDSNRPGNYFVFYISVTGIYHLVDTINLAMLAIMAAALIICFLIANLIAESVTRPLRKLSTFAEALGQGHFERQQFAFKDIEFEELGEAMNQSAEKLDLYDKDQRTFFQNVSHELRTPLQSIRCYGEGLEYGLMDAKKAGTTIVSETDRLSELVEDLLYISRIDSISGQFEKRENDLRDTLAHSAEAQKALAKKNGIQLVYEFDDEPVLFTYNEKHIYRAFSNLISNALRYAQHKVTLCCSQGPTGIEIAVSNDGAAISLEDLPHIFERFYKGKDGKHGIGLSIVKSAVELHGGKVFVESGEETRFRIQFPLS